MFIIYVKKVNNLFNLRRSQLQRKWKSLKETYFKVLGTLNKSGNSASGLQWPYFQAMHVILASCPRCKVCIMHVNLHELWAM